MISMDWKLAVRAGLVDDPSADLARHLGSQGPQDRDVVIGRRYLELLDDG